jgi:hypothetical protein
VVDSVYEYYVGHHPLSNVYLMYMEFWKMVIVLSSGDWLSLHKVKATIVKKMDTHQNSYIKTSATARKEPHKSGNHKSTVALPNIIGIP